MAQCPAPHKLQLTLKSKATAESHATETLRPVAESIPLHENHALEGPRPPKRTRFDDALAFNNETKRRKGIERERLRAIRDEIAEPLVVNSGELAKFMEKECY